MESQKKTLYITVGQKGSGKTSWVRSQNNSNSVIISRDEVKKSLFGGGISLNKRTPEQTQALNEAIQSKFTDFANSSLTTAYYDATNLRRKGRIQLYTWAKARGIRVIIRVFLKPLHQLLQINTNRDELHKVPLVLMMDSYSDLHVPRLGVDCDEVQVEGNLSDFKQEIEDGIHEKHDSPHHAESINEHILLTIVGCQEYQDKSYYQQLIEIASYHDLGKGVCRKIDTEDIPHKNYFREQNNGLYCTYMGHAEVSACYYLAYMNEEGLLGDKNAHQVMEAIFQHMNAHQGISQRVINRNKLTEQDLEVINAFKQIDSKSKRLNTDVYTEFNRIKAEYQESKKRL